MTRPAISGLALAVTVRPVPASKTLSPGREFEVYVDATSAVSFPNNDPEMRVLSAKARRLVRDDGQAFSDQEAIDYATVALIAECAKQLVVDARALWDEYYGAVDQERTEREWGRL